jgi:hypothetical protein
MDIMNEKFPFPPHVSFSPPGFHLCPWTIISVNTNEFFKNSENTYRGNRTWKTLFLGFLKEKKNGSNTCFYIAKLRQMFFRIFQKFNLYLPKFCFHKLGVKLDFWRVKMKRVRWKDKFSLRTAVHERPIMRLGWNGKWDRTKKTITFVTLSFFSRALRIYQNTLVRYLSRRHP